MKRVGEGAGSVSGVIGRKPLPMDPRTEVFGRNVLYLRKARGWPLRALSGKTGIAFSHISNIEKGRRDVSLSHALRIADALEVSVDVLVQRLPAAGDPMIDDAAGEES